MCFVSRTETFAKLFFLISFTGLVTYVVLAFYTFHTAYTTVTQMKTVQRRIQYWPDPDFGATGIRFAKDLKYILLWTALNDAVINTIGEGQTPFIENNCSFINCFLTTKKNLLNEDYKNFDAVLLELPILKRWRKHELPQMRSVKQKYVFRGILSSDDHPICNADADGYFNWTWSYKLGSEIFKPFYDIRDLNGKVVAPSIDIVWPTVTIKKENLPKKERVKLKSKKKAIAWIINKCGTRENRVAFAKELQFALKSLKLTLDIFGCENLQCPREGCMKAIETDYYFYLVFEDSIAEDYVTKEILKAYNNHAVPIVISGANLTKFLPTGSYINGRFASGDKLAAIIDYSIRNPTFYYSFHLWRNHYTFHEVEDTRGICELCNSLNNENMVTTVSNYDFFRKWWYNGTLRDRCYPKSAEKFDEVLSYLGDSRRNHS